MGIGRVVNGIMKSGDEVAYGKPGEPVKKGKINELFVFNNVGREKVETATAGDIVMMTGIADITIGDTVMSKVGALPPFLAPFLSLTPHVTPFLAGRADAVAVDHRGGAHGAHVHLREQVPLGGPRGQAAAVPRHPRPPLQGARPQRGAQGASPLI